MPSIKEGCLQTSGGHLWMAREPDTNKIVLEEMSLALSRIPRFGGHFIREIQHYSVAEHSVLCWNILLAIRPEAPPDLQLACLLHDCSEPYSGFGDVCGNMKCWAPIIGIVEHGIDFCIAIKYEFDAHLFYSKEVKEADLIALDCERKRIMPKLLAEPIPWPPCMVEYVPKWKLGLAPGLAEQMFLRSFNIIQEARDASETSNT